jgi:DNA-directed RNA polymerase subunit M/transcription elongation factor TFIIS
MSLPRRRAEEKGVSGPLVMPPAACKMADPKEITKMEQPKRSCPECRSGDYVFRGRSVVEADGKAATVTKYRCRVCGREWKEHVEK